MPRVELKHISVRPRNPFAGWLRPAGAVLFVLMITAAAAVWAQLWRPWSSPGHARWIEAGLILALMANTLGSLARQLPAQNVVLVAAVIALFAGAADILCALTAVPFGPVVYDPQNAGPAFFHVLPWSIPLIRIVAMLNSRGVARLILRQKRRSPNYGLWVIALTVGLLVIFQLSLEPYATQVKHYWAWKPTKLASDWYSSPWVNFLGTAVLGTLILLFVTPALINKSPHPPAPPPYHPLIVWELLSVLFVTGELLQGLRAAAVLTGSQMILIALLSVLGRGARGKA
jgi:hypothetical protein